MANTAMMVALDKGLNSVVPPIMAEPGTLLDCLNYEVVPQVGYKKIDGYEVYDGFQNGAVERVYRITLPSTATFALGDLLYTEGDWIVGVVVGIVSGTQLDFVQLGTADTLGTFTGVRPGAAGTEVAIVGTAESLSDLDSITAAQQTDLLRGYATYLRNQVGVAEGVVCGLHWFDDRLYAVVSDPSDGTIAHLFYAVDEFISEEAGIARGWQEVDTGMLVEFDQGYSPDDAFTHYTRAYSEVEDATSPTSVIGANGSVIAINQGVTVEDLATAQVKGWKPSSAPTTYDVSATDILTDDAAYVYADAVWSWDTGVSTVTARNGYRSTALVQNDPNYRLGGLTVAATPVSREFNASNAYTMLVMRGIQNLGDNLPKTALIRGIEIIVDYDAEVLTYGKNVSGDATAVENAAFDTINSMGLKASLLKETDDNTYETLGSPLRESLTVAKTSFTQSEEGTKDSDEEWHVYTISDQTATIGGSDDMFGNISLGYSDIVSKFGIGLSVDPALNQKPSYADSGAAAYRVKINRVRIKIHFDIKSSFYYVVGDAGTTVFKVNLTSAAVDYGNLSSGDARGIAHFTGAESIVGTRIVPEAGDLIYTKYPVVDDPVMQVISYEAATLPGHELLEANNSLYQFLTANFYGDEDWNAMYGVSGAGRAFFWDNNVLGFILTQYDATKDKPRHIAEHLNHLVLGFNTGSTQLSVLGEPTNFSGLQGASEFAMGDKVTGLLPLTGTTLGVFCSKSIQAISGSSVQNFDHQTIVPNQGAVEYSVVDAGQPTFATNSGISTLQQTAAYGDFAGSRLSDKVATWLPKRLLSTQRNGSSNGVACALPVRNKNQYRLFFKDGLVLSLTLDGDKNPIMTSRYTYEGDPLVPLAYTSQIDHTGTERVFISGRDVAVGSVFELDKGWGFNGTWFEHYFELAHIFPDQGVTFGQIEQIRLHGQSKGLATLDIKASGIEQDYQQTYHDRVQDLSMPINQDYIVSEFYPATSIIDHANWGLGIKLKIQGTTPADTADTEPSHICQALLLYVKNEGANDG